MAYSRNERTFGECILKSLDQEEIQDGINKARLSRERVTSIVEGKAEQIWNAVTDLIKRYEDIEEKLNWGKEALQRELPRRSGVLVVLDRISSPFWKLSLLLMAINVAGILFGWTDILGRFVPALTRWTVSSTMLVAGIALVILRAELNSENKSRMARFYTTGSAQFGIKDSEEKLFEAHFAIEAAVVESITREIRAIISKRIEDSYDTELAISEAPGLSEVFDSEYEIDTDAKRKLNFMLETMPGGSIGIAGPRGAGKTTLISSYCGDSVTEINGRKILPLLVSAPVEYESRDFLLHLFSSLCHRILERSNSQYRRIQWKGIEEVQPPTALRLIRSVPTFVILFFIIGAGFTAVSLTLAKLNLNAKRAAQSESPPTAGSQPNQTEGTIAQPEQSKETTAHKPPPSFLDELGLSLSPAPLFKWGCILVLLSLALYLTAWSRLGEHTRLRLVDPFFSSRGPLSFLDVPGTLKAMRRIHNSTGTPQSHPGVALSPDNTDVSPELVFEANEWLKEIKFQQSYTSGWSGALKFPIGLEGGLNAAVSMAQKQLSLPEIVAGFVGLLKSISVHYRVIIGIDELDKLESDEKAQQFLNAIKAVFGLNGVFYLVSVSESAMSSFERRGLPFRDVFDSSFDNIVHVNYLRFENAKSLLGRRVVGLPIPFVGLCYCASGGLARDLIRSCRNLIETNGMPDQKADLVSLSNTLIKADLDSKIRAISVSVDRINQEPERSELLEKLYQLETEPISFEALLSAYESLTTLSDTLKEKSDQEEYDAEAADLKKLAPLAGELAIYTYYSVTVLEFFARDSFVAGLNKQEGLAMLERLAKARQALCNNPVITNSLLNRFRAGAFMTVPVDSRRKAISDILRADVD